MKRMDSGKRPAIASRKSLLLEEQWKRWKREQVIDDPQIKKRMSHLHRDNASRPHFQVRTYAANMAWRERGVTLREAQGEVAQITDVAGSTLSLRSLADSMAPRKSGRQPSAGIAGMDVPFPRRFLGPSPSARQGRRPKPTVTRSIGQQRLPLHDFAAMSFTCGNI